MGEFSKRVGEIGEDIVGDFLALIGWKPVNNFDIPSINPDKHKQKSHGLDGFMHYKSPMISNTLENILISVKFSSNKYPNYPVSNFKEYFINLAIAIESFKKSNLRSETINSYSALESVFDRGIIFWINNHEDEYENVLEKLLKLEIPRDYNHDGIILIDNNKMKYFFNAIEFAKNKYPGKTIEFTYYNSGLNSDNSTPKKGKILPIQYLSSSILPMRIQGSENQNTMILCCQESFEKDTILKLMGLSKNISAEYQSKTIIAFPDYNRLEHEQIIDAVKLSISDASFTDNISVENFNPSFRN